VNALYPEQACEEVRALLAGWWLRKFKWQHKRETQDIMRQGQHNHNHKRSRGRGRGGRPGGGGGGGGGGNPINRVYESNGPDVKVRGTAQTIAEKYMQLARDAHSSGDIVMAESYNQHAEHYLRILAAAQAYNQQHMAQQQPFRRPLGGEDASEGYEEGGESEASAEGEGFSASGVEAPPPQPDVAVVDSDQHQQSRRQNEERPRQQFDRPRNGGDQPRQQPRVEDEADGWDGPQPQFLRRPQSNQGQPNGGDRQQRDRRPLRERGQRPREENAAPAGESAEGPAAGPTDSDKPAVN
jgi:hypothetical protein